MPSNMSFDVISINVTVCLGVVIVLLLLCSLLDFELFQVVF